MPLLSLDQPNSASQAESSTEPVRTDAVGTLAVSLETLQLCAHVLLAYSNGSVLQQAEYREAALVLTKLTGPEREELAKSLLAGNSATGSAAHAADAFPNMAAVRNLLALAEMQAASLATVSVPARPAQTATAPVTPAPLTTGRWDSGRRSRQIPQARVEPASGSSSAPTSGQYRTALSRSDSGRRILLGAKEDVVRSIPASAWIPRTPEAPEPEPPARPETPALTRRWDLLSRFDSGARPAAGRSDPSQPGGPKPSASGG